jgi:VCBS repeat protein
MDVPMLGDMDGDGKADLIVWRRWYPTFTWYWLTSASQYTVSRSAGFPIHDSDWKCTSFVADMDGDGRSDLVMWDRYQGEWGRRRPRILAGRQGAANLAAGIF